LTIIRPSQVSIITEEKTVAEVTQLLLTHFDISTALRLFSMDHGYQDIANILPSEFLGSIYGLLDDPER